MGLNLSVTVKETCSLFRVSLKFVPLSICNLTQSLNFCMLQQNRKKVIGLDDLLSDFYKEKSKLVDKQNKKRKVSKVYDSDDDEQGQVALLSQCVDECQNQV